MVTTIKNSTLLDELLDSITPSEQRRTDNRMLLAARIADVMQEKGITQTQLARRLGKHHSVISQWLSGTHNFTSDTLSDIESELGITLFQLIEQQPIVVNYMINLHQVVYNERTHAHHTPGSDGNKMNSSFSVKTSPKSERAYC